MDKVVYTVDEGSKGERIDKYISTQNVIIILLYRKK